jgi:hypothetical protein
MNPIFIAGGSLAAAIHRQLLNTDEARLGGVKHARSISGKRSEATVAWQELCSLLGQNRSWRFSY